MAEAITTTDSNTLEILGMKINSITEAMELANYFAQSDMVPKDYKGNPGNIIVAWQKGFEIGLKPQQSLDSIAVINGRGSIWGDAALALVKSSPKCEYIKEWTEGDGDNMIAYCETKTSSGQVVIRSFSVQDAIVAGLWGKNVWAKYPKRMLQMRPRGFCMRDVYPDVLYGLKIAEEMMDIDDAVIDTTSENTVTFEEIQNGLLPIGIELDYKNGLAVASGKTHENAKTLKDAGFTFTDGQYAIKCTPPKVKEEPKAINQIQEKEPVQPNEQQKVEYETAKVLSLEEMGLSVKVASNSTGTWEIIQGNIEGLEGELLSLGYGKGEKGGWGKLLKAPEQK